MSEELQNLLPSSDSTSFVLLLLLVVMIPTWEIWSKKWVRKLSMIFSVTLNRLSFKSNFNINSDTSITRYKCLMILNQTDRFFKALEASLLTFLAISLIVVIFSIKTRRETIFGHLFSHVSKKKVLEENPKHVKLRILSGVYTRNSRKKMSRTLRVNNIIKSEN